MSVLEWQMRYESVLKELNSAQTQAGAWKINCEKLQAFKDWVHGYLDTHGVPHHPPGPHGAEGCRIGDRMDWLMAERDALRAQLADVQEDLEDEQDSGDSAYAADTKRIYELRELTAERDALAVTAERQAEQIRRLRELLSDSLEYIEVNISEAKALRWWSAAEAILKETAP